MVYTQTVEIYCSVNRVTYASHIVREVRYVAQCHASYTVREVRYAAVSNA